MKFFILQQALYCFYCKKYFFMSHQIKTILSDFPSIIQLVIVLCISITITYVYHGFSKKISKRLKEAGHFIFNAFIRALYVPLIVFLWLNTAFFLIDNVSLIDATTYAAIHKFLVKIRLIGNTLAMGWFFMNLIKRLEVQAIEGNINSGLQDQTTIYAVGKAARVVAFLVTFICALPIFGMPISGLLTFTGVSAVLVAFGAQQILANYLSGLVIYSDRHFKVGDWVYSPDRNIEGVIESINWRTTTIRTFDKRALYVPNSIVSSISLINASRMTNWRIDETIHLRHKDIDVVDSITNAITGMFMSCKNLDKAQTNAANLRCISMYSLEINIVAHTIPMSRGEYRKTLHDLLLKIHQVIATYEAELTMLSFCERGTKFMQDH